MRTTRRLLGALFLALLAWGAAASPALACGGLVAPNGTVRLLRTATLAAYHQGVEHYITSFTFAGGGGEFGSIVPLPGVPSEVERGGDWTLQRLVRETAVRRVAADSFAAGAAATTSAEVLLEKRIDALDLTVLKGGAVAVGNWARAHGFNLSPDTPEVLEFYATRSPIFLAARFNAAAARQLGQEIGDGTPIHVTIPTRTPWVPLRILGLGRGPDEPIDADVFLLTDDKPELLGLRGLRQSTSAQASSELLADLRSDKGMGWVPQRMWLTHLEVAATARELDHDLAISVDGRTPSRIDAGYELASATTPSLDTPIAAEDDPPLWPFVVGTLALCAISVAVLNRRFG